MIPGSVKIFVCTRPVDTRYTLTGKPRPPPKPVKGEI